MDQENLDQGISGIRTVLLAAASVLPLSPPCSQCQPPTAAVMTWTPVAASSITSRLFLQSREPGCLRLMQLRDRMHSNEVTSALLASHASLVEDEVTVDSLLTWGTVRHV